MMKCYSRDSNQSKILYSSRKSYEYSNRISWN
jgi:hypothetical protein